MTQNQPETRITKAFSIERVKDGWVFVELGLEDGKIVSVTKTEPNIKAIAVDRFKLAAFDYWSKIGAWSDELGRAL